MRTSRKTTFKVRSGKVQKNNRSESFLLMDVLLHELGHHRDRMTPRSKSVQARGESYAEQYAVTYAERLWDGFWRVFAY